MENNCEVQELLTQIQQSAQQQARYSKLQCILTGVAAGCCVGLILLACVLLPEIRTVAGRMETVLENLEVVSEQLAAADLESMVRNVDSLAATTQTGVQQAMEKLNAIDFETLNRAIENLADVVEPVARFFNVFH